MSGSNENFLCAAENRRIAGNLLDHLVNALGTNGIRTKKVLFTISSTRVASREVQIPNVKASKIEALVKTNVIRIF